MEPVLHEAAADTAVSARETQRTDLGSARVDAVYVDLDGTLIATDLLHEGLMRALHLGPASIWALVRALASGRSELKQVLAAGTPFDATTLPYRPEVLSELRRFRQEGKRIVLATASPEVWARSVALHLQLFDAVLSTRDRVNLKGREKLRAIQTDLQEHCLESFAYYGDSRPDLHIWEMATEAIAVAPGPALRRRLATRSRPVRVLGGRASRSKAILRALRPHQWIKNVLLFAPPLLAHAFDREVVERGILAFCAFSLCASAVYVLNDVIDVAADRRHPHKRRRPFAAGTLPVAWALPLSAGLSAAGLTLGALMLPAPFLAVQCAYLILTTGYSFWLKRRPVLDVLVLAGLYTVRIVAGGLATGVAVSEWLMALSVFLFTSLAFAKRHTELARLAREGHVRPAGRGYQVEDLGILESIGPSSGYMAVLVLGLYLNSEAIQQAYSRPWALWLVCPVLLHWITRLWLLTKRGSLCEDPVVFVVKDRASLFTALVVAAVVVFASWPGR